MEFFESVDEMDRTDYRFEIARLQSFDSWAVSTVNSKYPEKLASAGFYYTGQYDVVKCFDCHVIISGWKENLDPLTEHKRRSPRCRFVRIIPCGNVSIDVDPDIIPPRVPKMREICELNPSELNLNNMIEVYFEDAEVFKIVKIGDLIGAMYPKFAHYESRLDTYMLWPETITQKKEDLAAAGFVCANDNDRVYCFYCGGGLEKWDPEDNPKQDHIKWYPRCKFINRVLAEDQS